VQKIFAFDVYAKYSIERNYILGCFSQIHIILYVKLQWNSLRTYTWSGSCKYWCGT